MRKINYVQRPFPEVTITANGTIPPLYSLDAVILRNAGTATVDLWGGAYTLSPGETISFNVTLDDAILNFTDVLVTFDTSTGVTQKLQIITVKSSPC